MAIFENNGAMTPWKKGDPITADRLNETVEELNRRHFAPPFQVSEQRGGSGSAIACTIVSIHANHLVCTKKSGGTISVARAEAARSPATETIQGTTWNYTYTDVVAGTPPHSGYQARTAISQPTTTTQEEQILLREYKVGGDLFAIRVSGGTGVPEADTYIEMHSDRTWYRKAAAT